METGGGGGTAGCFGAEVPGRGGAEVGGAVGGAGGADVGDVCDGAI